VRQAWIVRAGKDDAYDKASFTHGVVIAGWRRVGDLSKRTSRAEISQLVKKAYAELSPRAQDGRTVQLHAFRNVMQVDDFIVLLRSNTPRVAIGVVAGEYAYRPDLPAHHTRPVRWLCEDVPRGEIGVELLDPPALSAIYRISRGHVAERLEIKFDRDARLAQTKPPLNAADAEEPLDDDGLPETTWAYSDLGRNLNYARSLTSAGIHLEQLQVASFEVDDVYRAAWVQAVAALDHWVHQEIYDRMGRLSEKPLGKKPEKYRNLSLPLAAIEDVQSGKLSIREAIDSHVRSKLGFESYQNPDKIRQGLGYVTNVTDLWEQVARVLCEQDGTKGAHSGKSVQDRLREIVTRRNKIAHEYDADPDSPGGKRAIDAATTMQTIDWIGQVAAAILVVIDQG
jgi:restriction system protein